MTVVLAKTFGELKKKTIQVELFLVHRFVSTYGIIVDFQFRDLNRRQTKWRDEFAFLLYLFILIGSDSDELRLGKNENVDVVQRVHRQFRLARRRLNRLNDVKTRNVLVHRIQDDLQEGEKSSSNCSGRFRRLRVHSDRPCCSLISVC